MDKRRQSAGTMQAVLFIASAAGCVTSVFALLERGWLIGFSVFLLSLIAFALSRLFDLFSDLFSCVGRLEENFKPSPPSERNIVV